MKFSRAWIQDYVDLADLPDEEIGRRVTEIGHAVEAVEQHGTDTVFDLEVTTNRIDAMSHRGMARELGAALGRDVAPPLARRDPNEPVAKPEGHVQIRIEAPEMCRRYTALAIRDLTVRPSPPKIQQRLDAVGLRPINNVVDATNYVMLALGHPLHAFDLDRLADATIVVRRGRVGESMKSLDGETRRSDPQTVVIADAKRAVALGGIIGGFESEITDGTRNVLLECAWFDPATIRRAARRLGIKTDASYRFERGVDPNDTIEAAELTARLILEAAGGSATAPIDVVAAKTEPETIVLRAAKLHEASAGSVGIGYAFELLRRLGFGVEKIAEGLRVVVPTYRADVHEEMDLVEEVLRFYGFDNVPASLPRLTTGDVRREPVDIAEDEMRQVLAGCGLSEAINYSFIRREWNAIFSSEEPIAVTNALSENVASMRLSLLPGLLESVAFNRSYGTRDGALFEIGRTYHRMGKDGVHEHRRAAFVLFGSAPEHWGDPRRPFDFFDLKGTIEQAAMRFRSALEFRSSDTAWLVTGKRAVAFAGDRMVAEGGLLSREVLQAFAIKGDVLAAEVDLEALLTGRTEWRMSPVARFPGVPMILAMTHAPELEYRRLIDTIRSFEVPYLHEVGLRDRFVAEGSDTVKTTLGMWYQAFDRSLTQEEVAALQQQMATRLAAALPVKLITS